MSHVYWIMIRTLNRRCSSGGSGGKLSCSCCGCLCCEVEGLPHGNWIFRKNYRERTSPQDAHMVGLMLPVHSCAAVFLLTWILAKCMKRKSFPWTRNTWQASTDIVDPLPMFGHSCSENTFFVSIHSNEKSIKYLITKKMTWTIYFLF